jgi:hypothetical protein
MPMTDEYEDNKKEADKFLIAALSGLEHIPFVVAQELRRMADAAPPTCFTYTSPGIKTVWRAAADLLEERGG